MVIGLRDEDIQCEVLSNDRTLKTFDEKFQFIEGLEKGRKTKSQLHNETSSTNAMTSQYKREKQDKKTRKFTSTSESPRCIGGGSDSHSSEERSESCQA